MKTIPLTFEKAKEIQEALNLAANNASKVLKDIVGDEVGPMGLTPDHIKFSPEYQSALATFNHANARSRAFNGPFVKQFKKELAELRKAKRGY